MQQTTTLERIRPRIVVEGAIRFTVHASTGNCGHKAAAEGGVSNFTRAGVKGGELPPGHEPPKVRLGESAVPGRLGGGLTFEEQQSRIHMWAYRELTPNVRTYRKHPGDATLIRCSGLRAPGRFR